jgi:dTDP-4-dehydrorhamnose reductase
MTEKRILIFGGAGILGSALVAEMQPLGFALSAPLEAEVDITDPSRILEHMKKFEPDTVVNCAAFTKVDECETKKELAFKVNAEGAGNVAKAATKLGAAVVHISTDYIFNGDKPGEYVETDAPGPLNFYGKSKLFGEELVRKESSRHCIIRSSWLFGPGGDSFVTKIVKKARSGAMQLKVVSDEYGRPTYSKDLAQAIRLAVEKELRGIYHFCNKGRASWFEYAQEVFELMGKSIEIAPVTAEEYGLPAQRPKNSVLGTGKIEKALELEIRHHRLALEDYLRESLGVK